MSLPDVSEALFEFADPVKFTRVVKTATDGVVVETPDGVLQSIPFMAVVEPISAQRLMVKPEGQRSWTWLTLWTTQKLKLDDLIVTADLKRFRVMSVADWSKAGYYFYEITQTFNAGGV